MGTNTTSERRLAVAQSEQESHVVSGECGSQWLPDTEVFCQLELGHEGSTCWSKYRIEYENGDVSKGQLFWASPTNLESQKRKEDQWPVTPQS
jgi:hypothetical protein